MNVTLVMFTADGTRRDFRMTKNRIILGRTNTCDLRIPLSSVSRQHCELFVDGKALKARDLGSSNGTFHNSIRIQEATLAPGDEIAVGPVVFTVIIDGQPAQIEPVRTVLDGQVPNQVKVSVPPPTGAAGLEEDVERNPANADLADMAMEDIAIAEDNELPAFVEPEASSTVANSLDDPIAALEALAEAEQTTPGDLPQLSEDQPKSRPHPHPQPKPQPKLDE